MRILISRSILLSASSIDENFVEALELIGVARKIIVEIHNLNKYSDIYRNRPKLYNAVLISALATLFLGICHKPDDFGALCRDEFHDAMELLKSNNGSTSMSVRTRNLIQAIQRAISMVYSSRQPRQKTSFQTTRTFDRNDMMSNSSRNLSVPIFDQFTTPSDTTLFPVVNGIAEEFDFTHFLDNVGDFDTSFVTDGKDDEFMSQLMADLI